MQNFFRRLDEIALINPENKRAARLERIAFIFLTLMILSAPHSIAATQTAWILGMLAWIIRLFIKPRPKFFRTPLDVALWAFFGWSVVSSFFSYAPDISLDKLRGVALFLIFYFVINVVRTARAAVFLACAMIFSCMFNVLLVPVERLVGRGVEIQGIRAESPLAKALLMNGDTLLKANNKKISAPDDLVKEIETSETTSVFFYRPDFYFAVDVKRENLLGGTNALEKLGIENWKRSHNWRSTGFYGHWTTYAEVLQLIASLTFGLLIASIGGEKFSVRRRGNAEMEIEKKKNRPRKFAVLSFLFYPFRFPFYLLLFSFGMMLFALLLNATRASQAGLMISCFVITLLGGNRRIILTLAAIALPLAIIGSIYLQLSRNVGFIDQQDESTKYRETVYREGFHLWTQNPRHFFLGVGMDSIKRYAGAWHLFDDGRLPMGHFHSTPLQLLVERGLPALLLWSWILWIYGSELWRGIKNYKLKITNSWIDSENSEIGNLNSENEKSQIPNPKSKIEFGILLGCFGGLIGFITSGFVHYNLGDQEVAMVFFLLMGLSFVLIKPAPSYQADSVRA